MPGRYAQQKACLQDSRAVTVMMVASLPSKPKMPKIPRMPWIF
jgi:hypothetical protein